MEIKAIGFDIGHTLVKYNNPLSWKSLYPDALRKVMYDCRIDETDNKMELAIRVLSKYNTRENPREYEVSSRV
jgi:putative hydrolase of the HAD superfamily